MKKSLGISLLLTGCLGGYSVFALTLDRIPNEAGPALIKQTVNNIAGQIETNDTTVSQARGVIETNLTGLGTSFSNSVTLVN